MKKKHVKRALREAKEAEKSAQRLKDKQVMIEKAINLKLMCDYAVSCSYGDLVLIICMLHDYVKLLDEAKGEDIQYQAYYRKRFLHIADHLAEQLEYDYDKKMDICKKKWDKESSSDIGGDAMELAYKKAQREAQKKEAEKE